MYNKEDSKAMGIFFIVCIGFLSHLNCAESGAAAAHPWISEEEVAMHHRLKDTDPEVALAEARLSECVYPLDQEHILGLLLSYGIVEDPATLKRIYGIKLAHFSRFPGIGVHYIPGAHIILINGGIFPNPGESLAFRRMPEIQALRTPAVQVYQLLLGLQMYKYMISDPLASQADDDVRTMKGAMKDMRCAPCIREALTRTLQYPLEHVEALVKENDLGNKRCTLCVAKIVEMIPGGMPGGKIRIRTEGEEAAGGAGGVVMSSAAGGAGSSSAGGGGATRTVLRASRGARVSGDGGGGAGGLAGELL